MKLDQSHAGRTVRSQNGLVVGVLIGFDEGQVVLKYGNGDYFKHLNSEDVERENPWELVSEPKKPSERIREILVRDYPNQVVHTPEGYYAIMSYLDEVHAEKSK